MLRTLKTHSPEVTSAQAPSQYHSTQVSGHLEDGTDSEVLTNINYFRY